jgi:tRNA pseudouridine32 synthase/23S rRNA pseudouridine746 synthase
LSPLSDENRPFAARLLLHADSHLLVFDKPAGLAVQDGSGVAMSLDRLLSAFARSNGKRPRLVHRLDRETSGLVIAARTQPAAAFLSQAFAERQVEKTYLAIVCGGAPSPPEGVIDRALHRTKVKGVDLVRPAREGEAAQSAVTHYRTLDAQGSAGLLLLQPETGRMHQLRAHLAAIGRPIFGDGKYGGLFKLAGVGAPRIMLHAWRLTVPHPEGGKRAFEAQPPPDLTATLTALGLKSMLLETVP